MGRHLFLHAETILFYFVHSLYPTKKICFKSEWKAIRAKVANSFFLLLGFVVLAKNRFVAYALRLGFNDLYQYLWLRKGGPGAIPNPAANQRYTNTTGIILPSFYFIIFAFEGSTRNIFAQC